VRILIVSLVTIHLSQSTVFAQDIQQEIAAELKEKFHSKSFDEPKKPLVFSQEDSKIKSTSNTMQNQMLRLPPKINNHQDILADLLKKMDHK